MKKIFIIVIASIFYFSNAFAVTLLDALNQTYKNNIQLNAERENIKASEQDVNIAKADYKPSLTLSGSQSFENTNKLTNQSGGDATINDVDPFTTSIKLIAIKKDMVWCDDVTSKYYNKLIKKNKKVRYENLYKKNSHYDFLIPINYNTLRIKKNKGSAIFIHLTKNYRGTMGCIALNKKDMLILLKIIRKDTKIKII